MLTNTFTSTIIVVNQWLFHQHRYQDLVLILFLSTRLYTKNNSTKISILSQRSPTPLARLLLKYWQYLRLFLWSRSLTANNRLWILHWYWERQSCLLSPTNIWCFWGKIMMEYITQLENNNWIRDCTGPWGALLLLATKPHQGVVFTLINIFSSIVR